jgi:hypothetical protein
LPERALRMRINDLAFRVRYPPLDSDPRFELRRLFRAPNGDLIRVILSDLHGLRGRIWTPRPFFGIHKARFSLKNSLLRSHQEERFLGDTLRSDIRDSLNDFRGRSRAISGEKHVCDVGAFHLNPGPQVEPEPCRHKKPRPSIRGRLQTTPPSHS